MKTLLLTGGCGFIGSNFVKGFLRSHEAWKVVNLDKLTYCGLKANTDGMEAAGRYEFVEGDVCDGELVKKLTDTADAVIHFAAETHVDRSIASGEAFLKTNVIGTANLIEAARQNKIRRFIHISSDEVYGSIAEGAVDEGAPLQPNSPYSASKAAGDLLVRAYWKTYQYPAIIVRMSNNFGPYQFPEKVMPLFITNLLERKKVPLYGKGENRRDWIYVEDTCRAIEFIFDKGRDGQIYNVAGGNEKSNRELTEMILKRMGLGEEWIQPVEDRPGHDFRYAINASKLAKLGFTPERKFEEALDQTIEWYRSRADWWKPLKQDRFTVK